MKEGVKRLQAGKEFFTPELCHTPRFRNEAYEDLG